MGVEQLIPAIYEDGVFKPLEPVYGVTEHAQAHLIIQTKEDMAQHIAESQRLARERLERLTEEQLAIIVDDILQNSSRTAVQMALIPGVLLLSAFRAFAHAN